MNTTNFAQQVVKPRSETYSLAMLSMVIVFAK
jgi:hypothetical protein